MTVGGALALPASPVAQTTQDDQPVAAGGTAPPSGEDPLRPTAAEPAPRSLRRAYLRWRHKLDRVGAYTGRNLLAEARPSDDAAVAGPAARELRQSIHRMQKRLHRYLRTAEGRAAVFKLKLRKIPSWGRGHLRSIAWCESKNDPRAIGGGGAYRGMYQFSFSTWAVVGGSGDPVAASRSEQTWRAWLLLSRHGSGHWPVCG